MSGMSRISNTVFVPTNVFVEYSECGAEYAQIRYHVMCEATTLKVAHAGRAIVFPSLRITEGPDESLEGTRITIRAQIAPMEVE